MSHNKTDLKPGRFPEQLKWTQDEAVESLEKVFQFVIDECHRTIEWYFDKKYWRRILGRVFGSAAIMILGISAIIPVLSEISKANHIPYISSMWATVAAVFAGILIGFDRFGGWTSSWIRFVQTAQELSRLQSDFQFEWEKFRLTLHGGKSDPDALRAGLEMCRNFSQQIHANVNAETGKWAQEFQKAITEVDKQTKAK